MANDTNDARLVCPRCGGVKGGSIFCTGCGLNLPQQGELPTAEEFAAKQRERTWLAAQAPEQETPLGRERNFSATSGMGDDHERSQPPGLPQPSAQEGTGTRQRWVLGLVVTMLTLAASVAGYAIGSSSGEDLDTARLSGERAGERSGAAQGSERGYDKGFEEGRSDAYAAASDKAEANADPTAPEAPAPAAKAQDEGDQQLDCGTVMAAGQAIGVKVDNFYGTSPELCDSAFEAVEALARGDEPNGYICESSDPLGAACYAGDVSFTTYLP